MDCGPQSRAVHTDRLPVLLLPPDAGRRQGLEEAGG